MPLQLQKITSRGIEDQWLAFAEAHWMEHVPEEMHPWFEVNVPQFQALEDAGIMQGYVAMLDEVTVGYALVAKTPQLFTASIPEWTIMCIYTHPGARRAGVFHGIMQAIEHEARAEGVQMLTMQAPHNFKADGYMTGAGYRAMETVYRKQLR